MREGTLKELARSQPAAQCQTRACHCHLSFVARVNDSPVPCPQTPMLDLKLSPTDSAVLNALNLDLMAIQVPGSAWLKVACRV
jgi:hypothetical protein